MKLIKGKASYKLPKEIHQINSVNVKENKSLYFNCLHHVPETFFVDENLIGRPQFFSIKGGRIFFKPIPDNAYIATIRYTIIKEI